ncbi:Pet127 family protein [Aspergillus saccharolyticus JOP 1030-1]|uniref:Pet127-domain-containing protein n=1 Tax=Aspergillus saccharolyticus JOP 1030-1 TaxID=1450539 RepID=A0A318ZV61_9EURO|nr:Pet127-domain-containing protein [Aspergillus saccharolyticus JOP 1030-1]PYH48253.1 Pet127-domain-containing protein [Aspergillus saccharolyticus JOP 1030-1]
MLRASWRSAVTPRRGHGCWSCLSRGFNAPPHQQLWARSLHHESPPCPEAASGAEAEAPNKAPIPNQSDVQLRSDQDHRQQKQQQQQQQQQEEQPEQQPEQQEPAGNVRKPYSIMPELPFTATHCNVRRIMKPESVQPLPVKTADVPSLAFGLDRVLFNHGVYTLRDPRSRVYNFDPYLGSIMPVTEFDFQALKDYITSSKDKQLHSLARKKGKKYIGSSSSMTSVLSHFHYLLSAWRPVDTSILSQGFTENLKTFTRLLRAPAAMFLHYQDGVYAIDADKEFDSANILMNLGKSMEKLLTLPKEEFERYRRTSANKITPEEENAIPESYHYSTHGDFLMRSQLDAYDPRLPGTGMFDLKTRAVVSIRMDARNFEQGLGYEIRRPFGLYESYEREYYDMIRAAFLKYSLQVRVGRMDGIFVAFHNIERIFGFQYISLNEMDKALHGQYKNALGDREFEHSIQIWNDILDRATKKFPKQSLRFHFETRGENSRSKPYMLIFAEPVTPDEIEAIQNKNKEVIDAYQKRILNLPDEPVATSTNDLVEEEDPALEDDDAVYDSTLKDPTEAIPEEKADEDEFFCLNSKSEAEEGKELFAAVLTLENFVNGQRVVRPEIFTRKDQWEIAYKIHYLDGADAETRKFYRACQRRRRDALDYAKSDGSTPYLRKLREIAQRGRRYRERQTSMDSKSEPVVFRTLSPTGPSVPLKSHARHHPKTGPGVRYVANKSSKGEKPRDKPFNKTREAFRRRPSSKPQSFQKTTEQPAERPAKQTSPPR